MNGCYFVSSFKRMDLGIKEMTWKATDSIHGSGLGAGGIKL